MEKTTYVYVVKEIGTSFCKVGVSENVRERVKQLQAGNPRGFHILATQGFKHKKTALKVEAEIIRGGKRWSLGREWFELSGESVLARIESFLIRQAEKESGGTKGAKWNEVM